MIKLLVILFALYALGESQVSLKPGKAYSASTSFNYWSYYYIPASESTANYVQLISNVTSVSQGFITFLYLFYIF